MAEPAGEMTDSAVPTPSPPAGLLVVGESTFTRPVEANRPTGSPSWLLMWTTRGRGVVHQEDTVLTAHPGQLVLIEPGVRHTYGVAPDAGEWSLLWAHFLAPQENWLRVNRHLTPRASGAAEAIEDAFARLHRYARLTGDRVPPTPAELPAFAARPEQQSLAMCVLEEIVRLAALAGPAVPPPGPDPRIARVQRLIAETPEAPHTLISLAAHAGLSPSRFSHLYTSSTGRSPMREVRARRMHRAAQLLTGTGMSVAAIARTVGYVDQFHFSRAFRLEFGLPPSSYRRDGGVGPE
ncbi:helix-turn-helix domain-containing protein [Allokutzneria sp. NRRL B-24872]|uniref:helix-turn-helix domain-containing protein n=1 Tax=Allokutzneria sp. NRRL B-24872 TaxID=1137961 RepID=UPI000A379279|nr:helix-turn-helix domain-containing protein [Allokutzneria sp. NRRL B-24872]